MADKSDLVIAIDNFVESQTFSLDAIKNIEALRVRAAELESQLSTYKRMYQGELTKRQELEDTNRQLSSRESAVEAREKVVGELEKKALVGETKAAAYQDIVTKMFANRQTRENIVASRGHYDPGRGYSHNSADSETATREEG